MLPLVQNVGRNQQSFEDGSAAFLFPTRQLAPCLLEQAGH
jgi:hypothetical protein